MPAGSPSRLKPRDQRSALVDEIIARLQDAVAGIPGMTVYFQADAGHPDFDARRAARNTSTRWSAPMRAEVLDWADKLTRQLRSDPALREVASEAQEGGPRVNVDVDREQAGRLGVSMQSVTDTLNDAFGQRQISTIYGQANQYRVILEAQPRYQQDPGSLSKLYVTGASTSTGTAATVANTATGTTNTNTTRHAQHRDRLQPGAARRLRPFRERARRRWRSRTRSSSPRSPSASIWRPATRCATRSPPSARRSRTSACRRR